MGKINRCLKRVFIIFNSLFVIIGSVLICCTVRLSDYSHEVSGNGVLALVWSWVFGITIIGISSLGISAARSESVFALKTFAGFMGAGLIIMLICGFIVVAKGNELKEAFNMNYRKHIDSIMKHEDGRKLLKSLQESDKCCGFMKAEDWGSDIPQSCACNGTLECKSRPGTTGPDQIYAKGCREDIFQYIDMIIIGISFGFSPIALLGLLASLFMIRQIQNHDSSAGEYSMAMKDFQRGAL
ncbi:tetraspanin-8-like isoform X1 [Mugil cephalus]|uniref:tetraspanin-8-like isoform X1 n=1 Tax=Mugil cephalus TaxID=48193 RepID=UPI001FB634A0|nr:tetraspanin-8-like isoform X1 [Mugil cephalus]